jgi:hypothetical protein
MLSAGTKQPNVETRTAPLRPLLEMSLRGLASMFYPGRNLFSYKMTRSVGGDMVNEGVSHRYTVITLLGLLRAMQAGLHAPFDTRAIFDELSRDTKWIDSAGDWGLLLWLTALSAPADLPRLIIRADLVTLLDRFRDARESRTMEMAWVLAALAHMRMANPRLANFSALALRIYRRLIENQGTAGIFAHQAGESYIGRLRGRLGSFADQVYPIYALAKFAQAWGVDEALLHARRCADTLCQLQGKLGQWWWHYDSGCGRVVGEYPVFSVHQDGMAPMALFAVSEACGANYDGPVRRGLDWIRGRNELNVDMCGPSTNTIWRCICQSAVRKYSSELLELARLPHSPGELRVLCECRPYHLGWLLYSFSSASVDPRSSKTPAGLLG